MKYSHSKAVAVFHKIVKLAKNGVLMIIQQKSLIIAFSGFKLSGSNNKKKDCEPWQETS
jgi:hypothetical protein